MKKKLFLSAFIIIISIANLRAQQFEIHPVYYTIFDHDSLSGFNESAARAAAIQDGFLGSEFKIRLYRMKREYIKQKYNHSDANLKQAHDYFNSPAFAKTSVVPGCLNSDFEASSAAVIDSADQISGWTITGGYNGYLNPGDSPYFPNGLNGANSCNLLGCCPMPPVHSELIDCSIPGGYIDNSIGAQYPIFSVFGTGTVPGASASNTQITQGMFGTKVLRLNDQLTGDYSIAKLSKTFQVTTSSNLFQFAFISVFSPGHGCCDAGGLQIKLYNHGNTSTGTPTFITCPTLSVSVPSGACTTTLPTQFYVIQSWTPHSNSNFLNIYNPWKAGSLDLSFYNGKYVTIEVITSDCSAGGHFGCVYFDAKCSSAEIDLGPTADSSQVICAPVATLTAPSGYDSYLWTGPGAFTSTNAIINTATPGIYTLQMNGFLSCAPVTKTVSVALSDTLHTISSSDSLVCRGEGVVLTAQGMYNCVWNTGDQTPSLFIAPDSTTTYYVNGINPEGCHVSATYVQHVLECTGLNAPKAASDFNLFPNPNSGEFVLMLKESVEKSELVVTNAIGQEVHRQAINETQNTIRLKNPKPGIYFYSLKNKKEEVIKGKFKIE